MTTIANSRPVRRAAAVEEPEWPVWALVALMLLAGLALRTGLEERTQSVNQEGITFSYPAGWSALGNDDPNQLVRVGDNVGASAFPTQLSLRRLPVAEVSRNLQSLGDIALAWSAQQSGELTEYRVLGVEPRTVAGLPAVAIDYAYIAAPVLGGGATNLPIVARSQDLLLQQEPNLIIMTFASDKDAYTAAQGTWQRIQASLRVAGK